MQSAGHCNVQRDRFSPCSMQGAALLLHTSTTHLTNRTQIYSYCEAKYSCVNILTHLTQRVLPVPTGEGSDLNRTQLKTVMVITHKEWVSSRPHFGQVQNFPSMFPLPPSCGQKALWHHDCWCIAEIFCHCETDSHNGLRIYWEKITTSLCLVCWGFISLRGEFWFGQYVLFCEIANGGCAVAMTVHMLCYQHMYSSSLKHTCI